MTAAKRAQRRAGAVSINVHEDNAPAVKLYLAHGLVAAGDGECSVIEDVMGILGRAWAGAVVQAILQGLEKLDVLEWHDAGKPAPAPGQNDPLLPEGPHRQRLVAHERIQRPRLGERRRPRAARQGASI